MCTVRELALLVCFVVLCGCGAKDAPAPDDAGTSPNPQAAAIAKGGALYDKFWKVSSASEPTDTHPLWEKRPDLETNKRTGADTWRCKECHGWDYKGAQGAYAKGSHRTGFEGVFQSEATQEEIVTSLAEAHGYRAAGLSDGELQALATFMREGLTDSSAWIDEEGTFRGDAERGKKLYLGGLGSNKACNACHGADGLKVPKGSPPDYDDFVGKIANKNPWEFLHKIRFGHPGTKMPASVRAGVPIQDVVDLCAYAQTLPKGK